MFQKPIRDIHHGIALVGWLVFHPTHGKSQIAQPKKDVYAKLAMQLFPYMWVVTIIPQ
jgi:hypothetical protein